MAGEVERDGIRDVQGIVVGAGGAVVRERDGAALQQLLLQRCPRRDGSHDADLAAIIFNVEIGNVAEEIPAVARRSAGGDDDVMHRIGPAGGHADGRARREGPDADLLRIRQIDVARRALRVGVAGDDRIAGNRERATEQAYATAHCIGDIAGNLSAVQCERGAGIDAHTATAASSASGEVVRDRASIHRKCAVTVHEHATAGIGGVSGDHAAIHRERGVSAHAHAAALLGAAAGDRAGRGDAVGEREVAAGGDGNHRVAAVARDRVSGEVEEDRARDNQGRVALPGGDVVRERHGAARVESGLQALPGHWHRETHLAVRQLHMITGIVAEEIGNVARRRAVGEDDRIAIFGLDLARHADGCARREAVDCDDVPARQTDVVRRAYGVGVAGDDGITGDRERVVP